MRHKKILLLVIVWCLMSVLGVDAQANLLTNPGFEQPYPGSYHRYAASGWSAWVGRGDADFYPEQYGSVRSGGNSQAIMPLDGLDNPDAHFDAAVYQVVAGIPAGSRVRATAWGSFYIAGKLDGSTNYAGTEARVYVGIDPNGGTNPNDGDVVWSGQLHASAGAAAGGTGWVVSYSQLAVEATTTGPSATVFVRIRQLWGGLEQRYFLDDAALVILTAGDGTVTDPGTGSAAATAVPPPPVSSFAQAQAPQEDGSIIHIVQSGNTVDAIAAAYGVSRDDILTLNDIGSGRMIYVGQQLLIKPAPGDAAVDNSQNRTSTTVAPSPTRRATAAGPTNTTAPIATKADADTPVPEESPEPEDTPVPPTETPVPTQTPVPDAPVELAEANPDAGMMTSVCVLLFEDLNMNRIQEQGENPLAGGMVTLEQGDAELDTVLTDTSPEPQCFNNLAAGEYTLAAVSPAGYGLTSPERLRLRVQTGQDLIMSFGAAQGIRAVASPPANVNNDLVVTTPPVVEDDSDSKLLQNIGLIVFGLAGLSLVGGVFIALILRRQ